MTLVQTDQSKDALKKYEEIWTKIKDLIRSVIINSHDYDEKHRKSKHNLDDRLPLKKTITFCHIIIVVRSVFHDANKYHPEIFLDDCS